MFKENIKPLQSSLENRYGIRIHDIDIEHGYEAGWNIRKNQPTGYHSARYHPELIHKVIHPPNKHGVYDALIKFNGKTKPSTCFPNDWNEFKMVNKLLEALCNGKIIKSRKNYIKVNGKTSEYITIEFYIHHNRTI